MVIIRVPGGSTVPSRCEHLAAIDTPCYFGQNVEVQLLAKITWDVNGSLARCSHVDGTVLPHWDSYWGHLQAFQPLKFHFTGEVQLAQRSLGSLLVYFATFLIKCDYDQDAIRGACNDLERTWGGIIECIRNSRNSRGSFRYILRPPMSSPGHDKPPVQHPSHNRI